jgi:alpha-galactosidase
MAKDMEDGSKAVGLFNTAEIQTEIKVSWEDLGIKGPHRVRDLWRQKDLGTSRNQFIAKAPRHGVVFVRMFPVNGTE